jgi:hypothetical protein
MTSFSVAHVGKKSGLCSLYVLESNSELYFSYVHLNGSQLCFSFTCWILISSYISLHSTIPFWVMVPLTCTYPILSQCLLTCSCSILSHCLHTCSYPILSCVSRYVKVSHSESRVSVRAVSPYVQISHSEPLVSVRAGIPLRTNPFLHLQVFNLSEPRRVTRSHHERVRELGWPADLAPPLERLCSVCKDIESWLSEDSHRIAVIHAR